MKSIRRFLGLIWMLLGPLCIYFLVDQATRKLSSPTSTVNDSLQWSIIIGVFCPIAFGMTIFGYYALKGEYDEIEA